jgi:tetratricopeptide (TPR) repeat protein
VGAHRRGGEFASKTTAAQFAGMRAAYDVAEREFEISLELEKRPLLTYLYAMDVVRSDGDVDIKRRFLDQSVAIDPANFIVREKYMGYLRTRWGGSPGEMWAFYAESQKAKLPEHQLQVLKSLALEDEAWVKQHQDNDIPGAIAKYREAADADPVRDCAVCGPLGQAADLSSKQGDFKSAIELYSRMLLQEPKSVEALNGRAFALSRTGDNDLAAQDLRASANLGSAHAQTQLARLLMSREPDVPGAKNKEAMQWLEKAADQGYKPAVDLLYNLTGRKVPAK